MKYPSSRELLHVAQNIATGANKDFPFFSLVEKFILKNVKHEFRDHCEEIADILKSQPTKISKPLKIELTFYVLTDK